MKIGTAFLSVTALVAACAPPQPTDSAPRPETVRAAPPMMIGSFALDSADVGSAARVPASSGQPAVMWGPMPEGRRQAARVPEYDLRHQATSIRLDWPRHALIGSTTITLAALERPLTRIRLDAVGMTFGRVRDARGGPLRHSFDSTALYVTLSRPLAPGATTTFTVDYETERPRKGFYFVDRLRAFWTQGETEDTRYWVPTYDFPNDKATWEFRVTVGATEKVLSNGRLAGTRAMPGGVEWHWILERPASTYLMSVAGGNYAIIADRHGELPVNYWTYPDSVEAARRGFGKTPRMIDIFERRIGVRYPWVKYDQIAAPDFIFGGMENVTATTQRDNSVLWPQSAEPQKNSDGLVSHELAHQWYGNLLTTRDWSHIWLNEGFATFFETIYFEDAGETERAAVDRRSNIAAAIIADRTARRPLVFDRWKADPLELFLSGHIYPKGAAVLQMIRHELGDSLFWLAIKDYTVRHSFGSVVSEDLRASLERASGRDFREFFAKWVYGSGFPSFRVSHSYDAVTRQLVIEATEMQPRDSLTGFFDPDVDILVTTAAGVIGGKVQVRGGRGSQTFTLPGPPMFIRWDNGDWLLDVTDFPRPTDMLVHQLMNDRDVTGRYEAIDELVRRTDVRMAMAALAEAARRDSYWGTRVKAITALSAFPPDTGIRSSLLEVSRDADARVREAAVGLLGRFTGAEVLERLRELATGDASLYVRGAALSSYVTVGALAALDSAEARAIVAQFPPERQ